MSDSSLSNSGSSGMFGGGWGLEAQLEGYQESELPINNDGNIRDGERERERERGREREKEREKEKQRVNDREKKVILYHVCMIFYTSYMIKVMMMR